MELDIEGAMKEIQENDQPAIERKTAITWAGRSAAGYILSYQATDLKEKLSWIFRAEELSHEAIEHAGLVCDEGKTVKEIQEKIDEYRNAVIEHLGLKE